MKYQVILIMIACFWFLESSLFYYMSQDIMFNQDYSTSFNSTLYNGSSSFNVTSDTEATGSPTSFIESTLSLFLYRISPDIFPSWLGRIINFINWLLLVMCIMAIYKIALPTQ